jgi:hypothetical protein
MDAIESGIALKRLKLFVIQRGPWIWGKKLCCGSGASGSIKMIDIWNTDLFDAIGPLPRP